MREQKLASNEVDKEKRNCRFNFNCVQVSQKVFMYHNFPDTKAVILKSKTGPLYLAD